MKMLARFLIALTIIGSASLGLAKTQGEYIQEAEKHHQSGYLQEAAKTMQEAVKEYPESSDAYSYLGLYLGMRAGQTNDMTEAMKLVEMSFETLDKAVSLDTQNPLAHFHRAIIALNVPEFFGKLETGIADLEFVVRMAEKAPGKFPMEQLVSAYDLLGAGYQSKEELEKAREAWEQVITMAPGSDLARNAQKNIEKVVQIKKDKAKPKQEKQPDSATIKELKEKIHKDAHDLALHLQLGKAYLKEGLFDNSEKTLKEAISIDPTSVDAHKLLAMTLIGKVSGGYDQKIYENTDYRSNIAFELTRVLDAAVALAPDDIELRLWRGIVGVEMPFFVGKLDQGIEDLSRVVQSDAPDSTKAEALYGLGVAYRKKSITSWIEVVSKHSDSPAAQLVFDSENPGVKRLHLSKHKLPVLVIDFVLGFRDELAPQTVVWIEDGDGNFVKTL